MKRIKHLIIAAALGLASVVGAVTISADRAEAAVEGTWLEGATGTSFRFADGTFARSEYVRGYWLNAKGYWNGKTQKAVWRKDAIGWWYKDGGWYPKSRWLKIDGDWYYFDETGYMVTDQYVDGWWVGADGRYDPDHKSGTWIRTRDGVQYESDGQIVRDQWMNIDGYDYYFDESGYMKTNELMVVIPQDQVYCFDENGRQAKYTRAMFAEGEETISIIFKCSAYKWDIFAKDLDAYLYATTDDNTDLMLEVNGIPRRLTFYNDMIYIDTMTISDFFNSITGNEIEVKITGSPKDILSSSLCGRGEFFTNHSGVDISIGTAEKGYSTITDMLLMRNFIYFTVETMGSDGEMLEEGFIAKSDANRYMYFGGDVTNSAFMKQMVKLGVLNVECMKNAEKH